MNWVKTKGTPYKNFYWQNGYGAFSISPSHVNKVRSYIRNQKQHHEKTSFQEEYKGTLIKFKVNFDERYVWD